MTAEEDTPLRPGYGRAADAPNGFQRWVLAEAHPFATAAITAGTLTALALLVAVIRGGTFTMDPALLAVVSQTAGTLLIFVLMHAFGWTRDRHDRVVKYLPPFPWSK